MDKLDQILHICKVIANKHGTSISAIGREAENDIHTMFEEAGIEKEMVRKGITVSSEYLALVEDRVEMLLTNCLSFAMKLGWSAEEYLELNNSVTVKRPSSNG